MSSELQAPLPHCVSLAEVGSLHASSEDVAPIAVAVVDDKGNIVSTAENEIQFFVSGDGTLAGVANGDPASHELNVAPQRNAFHGLAMVLVRAADHPGVIYCSRPVKRTVCSEHYHSGSRQSVQFRPSFARMRKPTYEDVSRCDASRKCEMAAEFMASG